MQEKIIIITIVISTIVMNSCFVLPVLISTIKTAVIDAVVLMTKLVVTVEVALVIVAVVVIVAEVVKATITVEIAVAVLAVVKKRRLHGGCGNTTSHRSLISDEGAE